MRSDRNPFRHYSQSMQFIYFLRDENSKFTKSVGVILRRKAKFKQKNIRKCITCQFLIFDLKYIQ